jgi:hypothetical protein
VIRRSWNRIERVFVYGENKDGGKRGLIVLAPDFEVTLRMIADRAFHWSSFTIMNIAAVPAIPF